MLRIAKNFFLCDFLQKFVLWRDRIEGSQGRKRPVGPAGISGAPQTETACGRSPHNLRFLEPLPDRRIGGQWRHSVQTCRSNSARRAAVLRALRTATCSIPPRTGTRGRRTCRRSYRSWSRTRRATRSGTASCRISPGRYVANLKCSCASTTMIPRHTRPAVENALRREAAVALVGPRQVGKTTLAHEIAATRPAFGLPRPGELDGPEKAVRRREQAGRQQQGNRSTDAAAIRGCRPGATAALRPAPPDGSP